MEKISPERESQLIKILIECELIKESQIKEITDKTRLYEDFQADSLDLYECGFRLEEELGISIPDEDMQGFRTIGDVRKYIETHKHY